MIACIVCLNEQVYARLSFGTVCTLHSVKRRPIFIPRSAAAKRKNAVELTLLICYDGKKDWTERKSIWACLYKYTMRTH